MEVKTMGKAREMNYAEEEDRMIVSNRNRRILLEDDGKEITIFFNPNDYSLKQDEAKKIARRLSWNGNCTGECLERFPYGEIKLYFNPVTQGFEERTEAIVAFVESLKQNEL